MKNVVSIAGQLNEPVDELQMLFVTRLFGEDWLLVGG